MNFSGNAIDVLNWPSETPVFFTHFFVGSLCPLTRTDSRKFNICIAPCVFCDLVLFICHLLNISGLTADECQNLIIFFHLLSIQSDRPPADRAGCLSSNRSKIWETSKSCRCTI